jgi:hypothetical protein
MARAGRWLARAGLAALVVLSLVLAGWSVRRIAENPLLRPVVNRTAAEVSAALEQALAEEASATVVAARLAALLAETPRNWIAITAVEEIAANRGLSLPPEVTAARTAAWEEESGWLATLGRCASCTWDAATCALSEALICNAPVTLTPVGDLMGVARAGVASATGTEIDRLDLTLSVIGLGATAVVLATGGTSYTLKAGASLLRLARRMSLISPRLLGLVTDAARGGIRWDAVLRMDSLTDPARLIDAQAVAPLAAVLSDLGRIDGSLGATRTLHILRHIDGPEDARRLAVASEAVGPRLVGALEVLGKSRVVRLAVRLSDEAAALIAGLVGLMLSLALAVGGLVQAWVLRSLRRGLRSAAR